MRVAAAAVALLLIAGTSRAADPLYLDALIETPLESLRTYFPKLKKEGCYRIGESRYLLVSIGSKRDRRPERVTLTSVEPCRRPEDITGLDVRHRGGVELGDSSLVIIQRIGRPDASTPPETPMRKFGDIEYLFMCRVQEGCTRHTSLFLRNGAVTGIVEWYSD